MSTNKKINNKPNKFKASNVSAKWTRRAKQCLLKHMREAVVSGNFTDSDLVSIIQNRNLSLINIIRDGFKFNSYVHYILVLNLALELVCNVIVLVYLNHLLILNYVGLQENLLTT